MVSVPAESANDSLTSTLASPATAVVLAGVEGRGLHRPKRGLAGAARRPRPRQAVEVLELGQIDAARSR